MLNKSLSLYICVCVLLLLDTDYNAMKPALTIIAFGIILDGKCCGCQIMKYQMQVPMVL